MISKAARKVIAQRLAAERGRIDKDAPTRIALMYPSPYSVGMSSLGYQQIYRAIQGMDGLCADRIFMPDDELAGENPEEAFSYERLEPLRSYPVLAVSVAYELEIAGLIRMLDIARIPAEAKDRGPEHPVVLAGGPLTFSNPLPLGPFVDAIVIGEAEDIIEFALHTILGADSRRSALQQLADHPHIYVPSLHGDELKPVAKCEDKMLPAHSAIRTPHTELSNMFLIETERGCSRGCKYCVMRRSTNGGMRLVSEEMLFSLIPDEAEKVGLVGAAVSDHPKIVQIVNRLADAGKRVGLSSLRPDRLKEPFVGALKRVGYKTLTTALDGISEKMRESIERRGREPHYRIAAENARLHGLERLKLYLMLGLPGETLEDIDEGVQFVSELSKIIPVSLGVAAFCAKRKTPLDGQAFAGIDVVDKRMEALRKGLRGRAEVRAMSTKWAWVEYVLAQGDAVEGLALMRAVRNGGSFAAYKAEFKELGYSTKGEQQARLATIPWLDPPPRHLIRLTPPTEKEPIAIGA